MNKQVKNPVGKLHVAELHFPELKIKPNQLYKIRGYFGNEFKEYDLLHNHDLNTGKDIYRYPAIQFKKIDNALSLFGYGDKAIDIFKTLFLKSYFIKIETQKFMANEKNFQVKSEKFGLQDESYVYKFISPWIALNQKNYKEYVYLDSEGKNKKLNSILINNIISFCKFTGYTIPDKIKIKSKFRQIEVNLKGIAHSGFTGEFMANFLLPDYLGLGKSSSRGYGCIKREM